MLMKMTSERLDPKFMVDIDVQKLIEDLVWKKYMNSLCVLRRCFCRRSDFHIDIRWGYFSFEDEPLTHNTVRDEKTEPMVQYSATYKCQLDGPQKHVFNAQGSQLDSQSVNLQRNYSIGGNLSLSVAGINFNLSSDKKIQDGNETKKETTTSWSETSEFTLNNNNSAEVLVEQQNHKMEKYFVVKTRLRLRPTQLGWGAPVIVRKKSNFQKVFQYEIISFKELFEPYKECSDLVEIRPQGHLMTFPDNKSQYYDEVYMFSRGILKTQEENRTVSIVSTN